MRVLQAVAAAGLLAATAVSIPAAEASAIAAEPCVRHDLKEPAGSTATNVRGTSPNGRFQVGEWEKDGGSRLVRWRLGEPEDLGPLGATEWPHTVSSTGEVIGWGMGEEGYYAWRQRDGERVRLPAPAGMEAVWVGGVTTAGQVSGGWREESADPWGGRTTAVVWDPNNVARKLPVPDGFESSAAGDIDADGTVLGKVETLDPKTGDPVKRRPIVWFPDGTWELLPPDEAVTSVDAEYVRNGVVAGRLIEKGHELMTLRISTGEIRGLGVTGRIWGLNARGSLIADIEGFANHVLIDRSGAIRTLPPKDGESGVQAEAVDDNDVVYGGDWSSPAPARWVCS